MPRMVTSVASRMAAVQMIPSTVLLSTLPTLITAVGENKTLANLLRGRVEVEMAKDESMYVWR